MYDSRPADVPDGASPKPRSRSTIPRRDARWGWTVAVLAILAIAASSPLPGQTPPPPPPHRLHALVAALETPFPAASRQPVTDRVLEVGHLRLEIQTGAIASLPGPDGKPLGLYFEGTGRYLYRSEDPADRVRFESRALAQFPGPARAPYTVSDPVSRTLFLFAAYPFEEGNDPWIATPPDPGPSASGTEPGRGRSRSGADSLRERLLGTDIPLVPLLGDARLNGGGHRYVLALLDGERKTVGYSLDGVETGTEALFLLRKNPGFDRESPSILSEQRLTGSDAATPPWRIREADLRVATEDNRSGRLDSGMTFEALGDGLSLLRLDLANNRDGRSYTWDSPKHRLEVQKVLLDESVELAFLHRNHRLLVELPAPAPTGQSIRLTFRSGGEFFTGLGGETFDSYFDLFEVAWYPVPAGWVPPPFPFTLHVRTRKPFLPLATGTTVELRESGEHFELTTRSTASVSRITVFAGKYVVSEGTFENLRVRVFAYSKGRKEVLEKLPRLANGFLRFYEGFLGPYPLDELKIVEVPKQGFGIGPPGVVILTTEAFNPQAIALRAREFHEALAPLAPGEWTTQVSRGINAMLAHEVAHQWFPARAYPASLADVWLSESVAEYLAGLAMGAADPDPRQAQGFREMVENWRHVAASCARDASLESAGQTRPESAAFDWYCVLYNRGPLVLHMLRTMVGHERFLQTLRAFLENAKGGAVTTQDLCAASESVVQQEMSWFFDQWHREPGIPEVHVEWGLEPAAGGGTALTGTVVQTAGPAYKKLLVPLVLEFGGGRREVRLVFQDRPHTEFRFELEARPAAVQVDPARNNLAVYR